MKKSIALFIPIVMLAIFASCNSPGRVTDFNDMDSKTFLESIEFPQNLSIDMNLDDIKSVDTAKTYKADYATFDKQKLINAFIKNKVTEEKIWAEGPQVIATSGNTKEYLNMQDGGKSFGVENGAKGGFIYSRIVDDVFEDKLDTVANNDFVYSTRYSVQKYRYNINADYSSYSNLSFLSYNAALTDIKNRLNMVGITEFDVDETYSLDLETMKSHYELYLKSEFCDEEMKNLNWTKDDECYIFSLTQLVDNIPIVNVQWIMPDGTKDSAVPNLMPSTSIKLIYDSRGMKEIRTSYIRNIVGEIESNHLINLYEALNKLIHDYSLTILEDKVSIVSAKLCYLSIPKDGMFELIPGWLFCSTKTEELDGETFIRCKYDVVNAVTGKLYQARW